MEDSGILRLSGIITDFSKWDDTINLYAEKFHEQFNVYPNILLVCGFTYRKIDLYAQMHPDRLVVSDGIEMIETSNEPYQGISYFTTEDYNLECCLDYDLPEGSFTLVFDEAPDFDGEPMEEPEELEGVFYFRKSA
jgi:hypothetical protein